MPTQPGVSRWPTGARWVPISARMRLLSALLLLLTAARAEDGPPDTSLEEEVEKYLEETEPPSSGTPWMLSLYFDQVDRVTILDGDEDLGLNTLDLVRPRSPRYRSTALDRSIRAPLREREVSVLTPEDFIVFKLLSSRDRDLTDARSVLRRAEQLVDLDLIHREVEALAGGIADHDIAGRWAGIRT